MNGPRVHLAGWQAIRWALDEDLVWAERSLRGAVRWSSLPTAEIVHAAWWPTLLSLPPGCLGGKTVVCFADNPPAFYLTQAGFERAAERVDLWIARTSEAAAQFRQLGLRVELAPYCVDREIFRPLSDRESIREQLGIASGAFVIGNFHRDSEGADLRRPKVQKGPDLFLEIVRSVFERRPETVVLLAGPRRHWLCGALERAGIPMVFGGTRPGGDDDFSTNILSREKLNRLYQALDVCLISSRWEGGPYSVLEALAAGVPVVSSPVGTCRDVLPGAALYESTAAAADILSRGELPRVAFPESHTAEALRKALLGIYGGLPVRRAGASEIVRSAWSRLRSCGRSGDWSGQASNEGVMSAMRAAQATPVENSGPVVFGPDSPVERCAAEILRVRSVANPPRIVGIVLVRNEDRFLERALRNAEGFCDHWILADNGSTDGTRRILEDFCERVPSAELHLLRAASESHGLVAGLAGTNTWVFALDGDEIYDPAGLRRLRERLRAGEASDAWMILGHVLHVTKLDGERGLASGHSTPPCRSMTKLYHFGAIDSWKGYCPERLHGGRVRFRTGYSDDRRRYLHDEEQWDASDFRCLHLCFLPRSSADRMAVIRANLMDLQGATRRSRICNAIRRRIGIPAQAVWKQDRYRRGPEVTLPMGDFFPGGVGC